MVTGETMKGRKGVKVRKVIVTVVCEVVSGRGEKGALELARNSDDGNEGE